MRLIRIKPTGRMANRMFQVLLARVFRERAPDAVIVGGRLPEFGIEGDDESALGDGWRTCPWLTIDSHVFDFDRYLRYFATVPDIVIDIRNISFRMHYYRGARGLAVETFPLRQKLVAEGFGRDKLVIHVRLGDILGGKHVNYFPLPIAWYRELVEESGKEPVFVGEMGDDAYSEALRAAFPSAAFITSERPIDDFSILAGSANVVLSISTFGWLAAWMSKRAERIDMPLAGLFNPLIRPDVDLMPLGDKRFRFHQFPHSVWTATAEELRQRIEGPSGAVVVGRPRLHRLGSAFKVPAIVRTENRIPLARDLREIASGVLGGRDRSVGGARRRGGKREPKAQEVDG